VEAPVIEPGTSVSVARNSDHRGGTWRYISEDRTLKIKVKFYIYAGPCMELRGSLVCGKVTNATRCVILPHTVKSLEFYTRTCIDVEFYFDSSML
jgi:hypothetical protein